MLEGAGSWRRAAYVTGIVCAKVLTQEETDILKKLQGLFESRFTGAEGERWEVKTIGWDRGMRSNLRDRGG